MKRTHTDRAERPRQCGFGGHNYFKDKQLHNPCAAAGGACCHLLTRCLCCKAAGGSPLWVCLRCWEEIAATIKDDLKKKEGAHAAVWCGAAVRCGAVRCGGGVGGAVRRCGGAVRRWRWRWQWRCGAVRCGVVSGCKLHRGTASELPSGLPRSAAGRVALIQVQKEWFFRRKMHI